MLPAIFPYLDRPKTVVLGCDLCIQLIWLHSLHSPALAELAELAALAALGKCSKLSLISYLGDEFVCFATCCATCALSRKPPAGELLSQQDFAVEAYDEAK